MLFSKPIEVPSAEIALAGRDTPVQLSGKHALNGRSMLPPYPEGYKTLRVAMGCFWGVERLFWQLKGVWVTAAGYAGGSTPNPSYEETCGGHTGHTEVVQLVYNSDQISTSKILETFWENHDPTQGMRQGNDKGTQYRSALYLDDADQLELALVSKQDYQEQLSKAGMGLITTEIRTEPVFYFAEEYHQQYLYKNPGGYCNLRGTGVHCVG
jgi:peptide-methionine (S)-S-oxide reductase